MGGPVQHLFVDTSAWFAYANRRDPHHQAVRSVIESCEGRILTTNLIFSETVTLCLARLGHAAAWRIGSVLRTPGVVDFLRVSSNDERAAWELFGQRPDKTYSFVDCTSFVLLRRLLHVRALALDADFRREGFFPLPD